MLDEHNSLSRDVYLRLHILMLMKKSKAQYWKEQNEDGSTSLYQATQAPVPNTASSINVKSTFSQLK